MVAAAMGLCLSSVEAQQSFQPRQNQPAPGPVKAKKNKKHELRVNSFINRGFESFNIVAVVDEEVILLEEILTAIKPDLEMRKKQMPPEQYKKYERDRIQAATKGRIQQVVILNELKRKLPDPSVMDRIRGAASGDFEKYMNRVAHDNKLKNKEELIEQLKKEGTDLATLREAWIDNLIAQQYLGSLIQPKVKDPSRLDMENYYRQHPDEFTEPAGVVWRQIEIKKSPDAKAALAKMQDVERQLKGGADFSDLAKAHSQGPTAAAGGLWSRTSPGSYADPIVDKILFSQPIGTPTGIVDGKSSYHLLLVDSRSTGEPKPFIEVQDQVRNKLRGLQMNDLRKMVVDELAASHHVTSVFDDPAAQVALPDTPETKK
jgi:parvulin-like peptidyl-prolyl isomerase